MEPEAQVSLGEPTAPKISKRRKRKGTGGSRIRKAANRKKKPGKKRMLRAESYLKVTLAPNSALTKGLEGVSGEAHTSVTYDLPGILQKKGALLTDPLRMRI